MERRGVWLIGARGSISAVTIAGHAALVQGIGPSVGLVTERPGFEPARIPWDSFVFGGHEICDEALFPRAERFLSACGVSGLAEQTRAALERADAWIRPGVVRGGGRQIEALAQKARVVSTDRQAVDLIREDLDAFKAAHGLDHLIVINLASTEPHPKALPEWDDLEGLDRLMETEVCALPPSSLYAYAALAGGDAHVNFTPSLGSRIGALMQLAQRHGALHAGNDGKTGETLVKSILAELFARRNLPVLSWFGQNILGNSDGRVLEDPENKAAKIRSKDRLLGEILGYSPQSRVGIDYVGSLGEWKIAWDHIHFEGFLGGRMNMQFTWTGVDSLLAAPLVLDLARLVSLAHSRGQTGLLPELAPFFKDPLGCDEHRLVAQDERLMEWVRAAV